MNGKFMLRMTVPCGHVCNSQAFINRWSGSAQFVEIVRDNANDTLETSREGTVHKAATVATNDVTKWLAVQMIIHAYMLLIR